MAGEQQKPEQKKAELGDLEAKAQATGGEADDDIVLLYPEYNPLTQKKGTTSFVLPDGTKITARTK